MTDPDGRQTAEAQWQTLVDELADETFDEALDGLVDEAAGRYLRARSRSSTGPDTAGLAAQDVEAWLAERAEVVDRALARLEAEYADRPMSEAEAEALADSMGAGTQAEGDAPAAATEQFIGGLVRKAAKAASSVAKAGISALGTLLPGRIFGLLRRLARPLLKRVLDKALGRLPAPLQEPARMLAAKLGYKVGYFVGSLSSTSINRELSKALIRIAPEDLEFTEIPVRNLPLYRPDYDANDPPEATALKYAIHPSDAILVVAPEYNRSIPGALKNAIDWASRPWGPERLRSHPRRHDRRLHRPDRDRPQPAEPAGRPQLLQRTTDDRS